MVITLPWSRGIAVLVAWFAMLAIATPAWAQQADLIVITRELEQGEIGAVRVRVRGDRPTAPPRISVSPTDGLNLTFQGQRQQVNIVNGRVSKSYEYTFGIEALDPGSYTLGPAEIEIGTQKILTSAGRVVVRPRRGAQTEDLQARAGFDSETAWVGEVVLYRRTIRSRQRILRDAWTDPPLDGLVPPRDGEPIYAEYPVQGPEGVTFVKEELHPKIVVEPGTRTVPAAVAKVSIAAAGGRPSPFLSTPSRTRVLPVSASELTVMELPPAPPGYSGLVGDFRFESRVDRTQAAVGDSINHTVIVRGDGTLERFVLPRPATLEGVRLYDGTPATTARVDSDGYKSEGRYSRVLVPTRPGVLQVEPLKVIAFSPTKGTYVTHEIELPSLEISRGKSGDSVFESFVEDTDGAALPVVEEVPYEGVREVRSAGAATVWTLTGWVPWTLGLAGLPLVALGLLELVVTGRRLGAGAVARLRRRKERELTPRQRLSRLPSDPSERLAELDAALRHALARKVGQDVQDLDRAAAIASLPESLRDRIVELTRRMDRARFGGSGSDEGFEVEVKDIIRALEGR